MQIQFLPSRINWVVQSSAVDYLHCLLACMAWLIEEYNLPARLAISIHDEVRYLCSADAANLVALALQVRVFCTHSTLVPFSLSLCHPLREEHTTQARNFS
ncbi:unnamed protein product [Protopolystoma xenopodis]|uniref:Uncharacterized protein n=1 Tax=Protopolystoma xenopodis TaxID=117903 RepID=A0A3S5AKH8_9PLAT|nr:unnamed protein product [Protopolystoma xenopodis]